MSIEIGLPVRDPGALRRAVDDVSNPKSAHFRHFITKEQFGEQHGASVSDYAALIEWAKAHNLDAVTHANRIIASISADAGDIERALDIKLNYATRPDGTRCRLPDREPSLDLAVPVLHVSGLDSFEEPKESVTDQNQGGNTTDADYAVTHTPPIQYAIGAVDIRNAYVGSSSLRGKGQTICIYNDTDRCIRLADIQTYATRYGLTYDGTHAWSSSQIVTETSAAICPENDGGGIPDATWYDGGNYQGGVPKFSTGNYPLPSGETTIDVTMAVAVAPGATILLYGSNGTNPLTNLATFADNGCRQVSSSRGMDSDLTAQNLLNEMALQGQSVFWASGDNGAWSSTNGTPVGWLPVTFVGGTALVMDAGHRVGEYGWSGSGGGWLDAEIPYYQLAAFGVAIYDAGVSFSVRNGPDVSAVGASYIDLWLTQFDASAPAGQQIYSGHGTGALNGTSYATPIWAGYAALVNEQLASNLGEDGGPGLGFANPVLYAIATSPDASVASSIRDITGNTNQTSKCDLDGGLSNPDCVINKYAAVEGYDLFTGLGSPTPNLITTLANYAGNPWTKWPSDKTPSDIVSIAASAGATLTVVSSNGDVTYLAPGASNTTEPSFSHTPVQIASANFGNAGGTLWMLDNNGHAYELFGSTWTEMNGTNCSTGNHNNLTALAVGTPGETSVWAISDTTQSGSNKTIYYTTGQGTSGECITWTEVTGYGGVAVAVSQGSGTPWVSASSGHLTMGSLSGGSWSFSKVAPFPWEIDGGAFDAGRFQGGFTSKSLAVGYADYADASHENGGWGAWDIDSSGDILDLVLFNGVADATWNFVPGLPSGAGTPEQISANDIAWVLDSNGALWYAWSFPPQ